MSEVVNATIVRKNDGTYAVDSNNPVFERMKSTSLDKYFDEQNKGVIKAIAQQKCGGKDGLEEAVRDGDVVVQSGADGRNYYIFPQFVAGRKASKVDKTAVTRCRDLELAQWEEVEAAMDSISWDFNIAPAYAQVLLSLENHESPLLDIRRTQISLSH